MDILNFIDEGWKEQLGTKEEFEKARQEKAEVEEYDKTHSICCDAQIVMGRCGECQEGV